MGDPYGGMYGGPGPMGDPYGGMYGGPGPMDPYGGYGGGFYDPYGGYTPSGGSFYDPITFSTATDFRTEVVSYLADQAAAGELFDHFENLSDGQHAFFRHSDGFLHDHGVPPERLISCDSAGCNYEHVDGTTHYHANPPAATFAEVFDRFREVSGVTKAEYRHIDTSTGAVTQHVHDGSMYLYQVFDSIEGDNDVRYRLINSYIPSETQIVVRRAPEPIDSFSSTSVRYGILDGDPGPGTVLINVGRLAVNDYFAGISGGKALFDNDPAPGVQGTYFERGSGIPNGAVYGTDVYRNEFIEVHRHTDGSLHPHNRTQEPFDRYELQGDNKHHAIYRHDDGTEHDHGTVEDPIDPDEPIDHYEVRADGYHAIHRHPDNTLHDHGVVAGTEVIHVHSDGTEHPH